MADMTPPIRFSSRVPKVPRGLAAFLRSLCFKSAIKSANKGAKGAKRGWLALLEAGFPLGSAVRDSSVRPPDGLAACWLTVYYLGQVVRMLAESAAIRLVSMTRHDPQPRFPRSGGG